MNLLASAASFAPSAAGVIAGRNPIAAVSARRGLATRTAFSGRAAQLRSASRGLASLNMKERERTFIMVKPDGLQRGLVGHIIARFEAKGFQLEALRQVSPSRGHLELHYEDLTLPVSCIIRTGHSTHQ